MNFGDVILSFLPRFALGLSVNFSIALSALALGLMLGLPLAAARRGPRWLASPAGAVLGLLRAAPTFVLIFFLLNAVPGPWTIGPWTGSITPWASVVIALGCYATAYVCDNTIEALAQRQQGHGGAMGLLVTSLVRALFVMVLSSGFAATVGVGEAVSATMRTLERLPALSDKLLLVALVMTLMTVTFQLIYALVGRVRDGLQRRAPTIDAGR